MIVETPSRSTTNYMLCHVAIMSYHRLSTCSGKMFMLIDDRFFPVCTQNTESCDLFATMFVISQSGHSFNCMFKWLAGELKAPVNEETLLLRYYVKCFYNNVSVFACASKICFGNKLFSAKKKVGCMHKWANTASFAEALKSCEVSRR